MKEQIEELLKKVIVKRLMEYDTIVAFLEQHPAIIEQIQMLINKVDSIFGELPHFISIVDYGHDNVQLFLDLNIITTRELRDAKYPEIMDYWIHVMKPGGLVNILFFGEVKKNGNK